MTRPLALTAALIAVLATGCTATEPAEGLPAEQPTVMADVTTACTPEGHRLYKFRPIGYKGGLAVVPNDPTCQETT